MYKFTSTRNNNNIKTASEAVLKGLAEDGGLFTPNLSEMPKFDLNSLLGLDYKELAITILSSILDDYSKEEIRESVEKAYDKKFEIDEIVGVNKKGDFNVLELYHGPTCAFKDMALTVLPHLLTKAYKKKNKDKTISILTATSGDTGKAALEGFKDVENTYITVFYPKEGVSTIQERQMLTTSGNNTCVVKVNGNFDDCQRIVKEAFDDEEINSLQNTELSSANSINLGRLIPQVVYYFYAYLTMVQRDEIKLNDEISFSVPSGNFGDILAGFIAKELGLPIKKLVCASNKNDVLTDFIKTGVYDRNRNFYTTISPSMDILISSNVERLLYILSDYDDLLVSSYMTSLKENGRYEVSDSIKSKIKELFDGYSYSDEDTKKTISDLYNKTNKIIDPHTAIAYKACIDYAKTNTEPIVCLSTASPYKFAKDVYMAIKNEELSDAFMYLEKLEEISDEKIPSSLKSLRNKEIKHDNLIDKENGLDFIYRKLKQL